MCDIEKLAEAINKLSHGIPINSDYWSTHEIAKLLKRSVNVVRDSIVHLPDFPPAHRIPSRKGGDGHPLWKAKEVLAWLEKYRDRT